MPTRKKSTLTAHLASSVNLETLARAHKFLDYINQRYEMGASRGEAYCEGINRSFEDLKPFFDDYKNNRLNVLRSASKAYEIARENAMAKALAEDQARFDEASAKEEREQNLMASGIPQDLWPYVGSA